jgi:transposase
MMGPRQVEQGALFYEFSLDTHVPADHLLRSIDRFVDLTGLRQELARFYASTGRPSVDPELMIRILIIGYCLGIRSERRLCDEVHLNLAYRWFCRLGLDGRVPDHSTFSKNRHGRFRDSDLLRRLFETVLARCIAEGLVGGEGFAFDGSLIRADANRQKGVEGSAGLPPESASRAAQEYLAVLDEAAFGAATPVPPKFISPADPAARWDRGTRRAGLLRLHGQLPDRPRPRDHRRRRADDRHPAGRGHSRQAHDRAIARALRSLSGPACGRQRLRLG